MADHDPARSPGRQGEGARLPRSCIRRHGCIDRARCRAEERCCAAEIRDEDVDASLRAVAEVAAVALPLGAEAVAEALYEIERPPNEPTWSDAIAAVEQEKAGDEAQRTAACRVHNVRARAAAGLNSYDLRALIAARTIMGIKDPTLNAVQCVVLNAMRWVDEVRSATSTATAPTEATAMGGEAQSYRLWSRAELFCEATNLRAERDRLTDDLAGAVRADEYGPIKMMPAWPADRDDDSSPDSTALSRALAMHDALPDEHRPPDNTPLRNCLPGIWPTVGDLRAALAGGAGGGSEPWETLDTCPSEGESVWIWRDGWGQPCRAAAKGSWWRDRSVEAAAFAPTHWCHDRAPAPPRAGQDGGGDA